MTAKKRAKATTVPQTAALADNMRALIQTTRNLHNRISALEAKRDREDNEVSVEEMFEALRYCPKVQTSTREFIDSLENGFEQYGQLTEKQHLCLVQNYNKYIHGIQFYAKDRAHG